MKTSVRQWLRMLRMAGASVAVLLFVLASPRASHAEEALVAVAANFAEVVEALEALFEQDRVHDVTIALGSTGKLYAQIVQGAPFDVLLAADQERPQRLESERRAVPGSRFTYAVGKLTLWSADPRRIESDGSRTLRAGNFRALAIANPELAPYGVAALQALQALSVYAALRDKLVMGEDIGQTYALVATRNAELGFVALSSIRSARSALEGSRWDVPEHLYAPIRQDAVLLARAANNPAARAFLDFLRSDAARQIIERFGYGAR